ncbi:putative sporulation protein YtxC [Brevibacillus humidisoli]|uniref:putative sporulation protein YtxC n=1 Tax=Brevibacillus humidisoli TaxID=2895522 RepID=UPI001E3664E7|nr:putative sporulation protein YtxC [Brevibacillus humidisoli]UFJ39221.1 putative sporulation protein YtxC [Brevibacillus humidisoli]
MQTLSVFLEADKPWHSEMFRTAIRKIESKVETGSVTIEYKEEMRGTYHVFRFVSWSSEEYTLETRDVVRSFIALVAVEWIVRVMEPDVIQGVLAKEYGPELAQEWEAVLPHIQHVLLDAEAGQTRDAATARKARIYRKIHAYLQDNHELVLEGFVRFRLKEYWDELAEAVEWGIEEYLREKEYREFVELLRYFISLQEARYRIVHVVPRNGKPYGLFDEKGQVIRLDQLDAMISHSEQEFRDEDYLVSALVTLAPLKIVLHRSEEKPALAETLRSIFGERLSYCGACAYCLSRNRTNLDFRKPTHYNT